MTAIRTENLTKRYGDVLAVAGLDLVVEEGEVFGFLGPNGAGKSTTIELLLDYARPTDGEARVLGLDPRSDSRELLRRTGVLPEGVGLYERLTGREHLGIAIEAMEADDDPDAVLERVGLEPEDAGRRAGEYSRGMAKRLALAVALVGDPDLLVLDEPASGLDPLGVRRMRELVHEEAARGTTVFFSSHVLDQVEAICDRVGILSGGRLVAVDTIDGLREAEGTGATVTLRLDGPPSRLASELRGMEGVADAEITGHALCVHCTDPRAKARVIARAERSAATVRDLTVEEPSLESLFADRTGDTTPPSIGRRSGGAGGTDHTAADVGAES